MSRRIGIASLIWGVSILLSRVIGVVREAVIGRVLGGGGEADVYWTAFVLPDFLNHLLAGGALSIVFIPIFAKYLAESREDEGWQVFSLIFNFCALLLLVFTATLWVFTPQLAPLIGPGFSPEQLALLTRLTRIVLPAQIFHVLGGLLSAVLQAKDRHTLPALANLGYTGFIIAMGLWLGPTLGAEGFAWGVLVGSAVGPFGLPLIGCLQTRLSWSPRLSMSDPDFRRYFVLSVPIMLTFSVVVADDWLIKHFGSLVGEGVVSQLQYARTLMRVPMGVFGLAAGTAAFPTLSRLVAEGKPHEAFDTLMRACRVLLVLALASQVAFTVAGADVAEVIWGTRRFSPDDLAQIGLYTGTFCLGLGAWAAQSLVSRGFYAMQQTWMPSVLGTVVVVLAWPVYGLLAREAGGLGLTLASSLAITAYTAWMTVVLRRRMGGPEAPGLIDLILRMCPAVLLSIAAGLALRSILPFPALLRGAVTGALGIAICLGLARLFGVAEVGAVIERVRGAISRRLRRRLPEREA